MGTLPEGMESRGEGRQAPSSRCGLPSPRGATTALQILPRSKRVRVLRHTGKLLVRSVDIRTLIASSLSWKRHFPFEHRSGTCSFRRSMDSGTNIRTECTPPRSAYAFPFQPSDSFGRKECFLCCLRRNVGDFEGPTLTSYDCEEAARLVPANSPQSRIISRVLVNASGRRWQPPAVPVTGPTIAVPSPVDSSAAEPRKMSVSSVAYSGTIC
jgi:hypothetical protein